MSEEKSNPAQHHHEKLPPYGTATQALYGIQLAIAYTRNGLVDGLPVDMACAIHGAHTAIGVGLSIVPHDHHEKFGSSAPLAEASEDELASRLEAALPAPTPEGKVGDAAIPWEIIIPLIVELIKRWISRK